MKKTLLCGKFLKVSRSQTFYIIICSYLFFLCRNFLLFSFHRFSTVFSLFLRFQFFILFFHYFGTLKWILKTFWSIALSQSVSLLIYREFENEKISNLSWEQNYLSSIVLQPMTYFPSTAFRLVHLYNMYYRGILYQNSSSLTLLIVSYNAYSSCFLFLKDTKTKSKNRVKV